MCINLKHYDELTWPCEMIKWSLALCRWVTTSQQAHIFTQIGAMEIEIPTCPLETVPAEQGVRIGVHCVELCTVKTLINVNSRFTKVCLYPLELCYTLHSTLSFPTPEHSKESAFHRLALKRTHSLQSSSFTAAEHSLGLGNVLHLWKPTGLLIRTRRILSTSPIPVRETEYQRWTSVC